MELQIVRRLQTTTYDPEGNKGLRQTMGHILVNDEDGNRVYEQMCVERPNIKKLPSVSRLPAGEYEYKIINKTPESPFSFIRILGTKFDIMCVDNYIDANHNIMVGKELLLDNTHYNLGGQREVLTEICKLLPEKGKLVIKDESKRDLQKQIPAQEEPEYQS